MRGAAAGARNRSTVPKPAEVQTRTVELAVTENGFEPSRVVVKKGELVTLVVTRKTAKTCATEIVMDNGVRADLPVDVPVTLTFRPKKNGDLNYGCAIDRVRGVVVVE